ncbi:uncharacterized protein LOC105443839 [Strongylocentrotus purpuratus]|uniref:Ig-like domain-containing protein n=1 Tax=Strongylocentrotus purpuratus TaxID=7668 RepID=A0A7M7NCI8_STRPU|nr:uncharacterized protein LOC105443839 [Strongylocentrotus purpuratus]
MEETNLNILRGALIDLGIPGVEDELTTDTAYDLLCEWKDANKLDNEGMRLKNVLHGHGLILSWKEMCVADHLLKVISPQEVEGFVDRLTERHCKRLANAVGITDEKKIKTIMDENNEDLVLIQSMVNDWIDGQECCNFEKRCMLDDATIKIGRHDMTDAFGTTSYRVKTGDNLERPHPDARTFNSSSIFDDDLASLLKHLPTGAIPLFLGKLGISVDEEGDDLEKLRCWRDQNIKESKRYSLQALVSIHSDALNEANDSHGNLLDVNDDELENVIASMTSMKQLEELTSRLGIKNDKEQSHILYLTEWRNRCKMDERRKTLREALNAMKLPGYDASLSELCNMTTGLSEDEIVKLVVHLGLEKDVLSVCQGTTGAYDNVKLMKVWKDQLRLQPLHFRFELAVGLRAVGRTTIASTILSGVSGDVPDDVVYTDLHKTVRKGDSVVLTCRFRGTPLAVWWKKGDDPETSPNLVSWIPTDDVTGLCEGERPCQIMEMNANRSLVIKEVSIAEQGRYICRVTIKGILIHNFTDISVFSPPMEPFPLIEECPGILPNDAEQTCSLPTFDIITITCSASSYFPDIDLFFLHGSKKTDATNIEEVANMDGTKNKSISIVAEPSESPYFCVASDIPGSQNQRTVTVTVTLLEYAVTMTSSSHQTSLAPSPRGDVAKVERRSDTESKVSEELLGHVLWSIGDETKIHQFFRELIPEKHENRSNVSGNKRNVIKEYMVVLREWRDRAQTENQTIQLSLALERAKCKPLDRTFFKVPEHLLKAISPQDVEGFIYRLTGRHCKRLAKAVGITDEKVITAIIYENNDDLFDTQSMIIDWVNGQECSNFEKRCTLDDAVIKIGRHDITVKRPAFLARQT